MAGSPTSNKAVAEYTIMRGKLTVTLMNPFISKEKKMKAFREYIDGLSDEMWQALGLPELDKMEIGKKTCMEYVGIEVQVKAFLEWLPRYKPFTDLVRDKIKYVRMRYDLPL